MISPLPPQAASLIRESPTLSNLASITVLQPFYYLVQQTIHWLFMGYSMTAFCLFTWDKWLKVSEGLLAKMGENHKTSGHKAHSMLFAYLSGLYLSTGV